eukprot:5260406-Pyramimonas_sp.AAC.3
MTVDWDRKQSELRRGESRWVQREGRGEGLLPPLRLDCSGMLSCSCSGVPRRGNRSGWQTGSAEGSEGARARKAARTLCGSGISPRSLALRNTLWRQHRAHLSSRRAREVKMV